MKKTVINGRFLVHKVTGVERYAREIVRELDKIVEQGQIEVAVPPEVNEWPSYQNIAVIKVGRWHGRLWEQLSFPIYVAKLGAISLNLCNSSPLLSPGIVCIHDVKIKAVPESFSRLFLIWYGMLFGNAAKRAKKIITVSEFSKKEIIKYYKIDGDKIAVIPNAWQHYERIGYDECAVERHHLVKNKYFFSMSSLEPNKNFRWIAEVAKRNPEYIFAVSGLVNERVFSDGLGFECPKNMRLLGYVSDEEAKALMRDCKAFLFPTFYEGFGIPPMEAMSAGAEVVVSDSEVMHEVYGETVHYINPMDYSIAFSDLLHHDLREESKCVLEKYSWERSAHKLKMVFRESACKVRG
nr:glycosyltransferase family 1 protein [uncultured Acetatifactor sp.]